MPFRQSGGEIRDRAGAVLATVSFDIWREGSNQGAGGEIDLWSGVLELEAAPHVVGKQNRELVADGVAYRIEDAIEHDALGYVQVTLRDPRAHG